jgi:hypothetical protein
MSWNLLIYKAASPDSEFLPMGSLEQVSKALSSTFPGLEWPADSRCELNIDRGFSILIDTKGGPVHCLYTNGGYDHLKLFATLCKANGWFIGDCQTGECVDLDDPYRWYEKTSTQS